MTSTTGLRETLEPCPLCGMYLRKALDPRLSMLEHPPNLHCPISALAFTDTPAQRAAWNRRPSPNGSGEQVSFDDPRVQAVYELLCDQTQPPPEEHWEGFAARRIVATLSASGPPDHIADAGKMVPAGSMAGPVPEGWKLVPEDLLTHLADWETACHIALQHAGPATVDGDDPSYWRHQLETIASIRNMLADRVLSMSDEQVLAEAGPKGVAEALAMKERILSSLAAAPAPALPEAKPVTPSREDVKAAIRKSLTDNLHDATTGAKWDADMLLAGCTHYQGKGYEKPAEAADHLAGDAADAVAALYASPVQVEREPKPVASPAEGEAVPVGYLRGSGVTMLAEGQVAALYPHRDYQASIPVYASPDREAATREAVIEDLVDAAKEVCEHMDEAGLLDGVDLLPLRAAIRALAQQAKPQQEKP